MTHARRRSRGGTRSTGTRSSGTAGTTTPTSGVPRQPRARSPAEVVGLQRTAGNRAVARLRDPDEEPFLVDTAQLSRFGAAQGWPEGTVATLYFRTGSHDLGPFAPAILDAIAEHFRDAHRALFVTIGHTDQRGFRDDRRSNRQLGIDRATTTAQALRAAIANAAPGRGTALDVLPEFGGVLPSDADPEALARCRRVDILVQDVEGPPPDPTEDELTEQIEEARPEARERKGQEADEAEEEAERREDERRSVFGAIFGGWDMDLESTDADRNPHHAPRAHERILDLMADPAARWTYYTSHDIDQRLRVYEGTPARRRGGIRATLDRQGFASDFKADVRRRFRNTPGDDPVDRLITAVETTEQELRDGVAKLKEMRVKRYAMESLSDHHEYVRLRRDIETWQADPRHVYSVYGDL